MDFPDTNMLGSMKNIEMKFLASVTESNSIGSRGWPSMLDQDASDLFFAGTNNLGL